MNQENEALLSQLNDNQRKAVEYIDGASLVIAGAGSGKTRVLTYKVPYLLKNGYMPWEVLALTFTNKAASEMKQRIASLVGNEKAAYLQMGTFHSVFARILRIEAAAIGYGSNYTIYDETDSRTLIKNIIKELQLDDTKYKPASVHNTISLAKNRLITAELYEQDGDARQRDQEANMPLLYQIYLQYAQRCRLGNAMDFDDLLLNTYMLFHQHEEIRRKYAERFRFVLVDEYQDTNYAQQQIVYLLTGEHQHVCVVGDDAQSIYAFRGANIDNILGFQQLYDNTQLFKLERNYRSTQKIVKAANSLIRHNQRQIQKDVYSRNDEGEPLHYFPLYSDREEVAIVSKYIRKIRREENASYGDFAILYRTNAQSRTFEEQFRKDNIPYRIYGGLSFYQRKEIKDVIAYLRLVTNPDDEEAFRRVINYPTRGIGNVTVGKLADAAREHHVSLWQVICRPEEAGLQMTKATATKVEGFRQLIGDYMKMAATDDVFAVGLHIVKSSGIVQEMEADHSPEGRARKENLDELLNGMKDFVDLRKEEGHEKEVFVTDYLQEVALLTDLDGGDEEEQNGRVAMMTVHSAKGLEFPTVFIVGLEENLFPSPLSSSSMRELEEERRLLYVAITRAEKHCFLSSAQHRMRYGRPEFNQQSRFLNDIDRRYMSIEGKEHDAAANASWARHKKNNSWMQNNRPVGWQFKADSKPKAVNPSRPSPSSQPSSHPSQSSPQQPTSGSPLPGLRVGCTVAHQRFGIGRVLQLEGKGENMKATVAFENAGTKLLLVRFARLTIVG
jgi:DNA helicase-2/ATP-dependent DNA helicase PcrA